MWIMVAKFNNCYSSILYCKAHNSYLLTVILLNELTQKTQRLYSYKLRTV